MRWVRTGQVRVDGHRSRPFDRLAAGQTVRIPPHAPDNPEQAPARPGPETPPKLSPSALASIPLRILHDAGDFIVVDKPAGLPTHPGTGHSDCLTARLSALFPEAPFAPTPAHRLDKDTSGLIAVALTYADLIRLQEALRTRQADKRYLAWVAGSWPRGEPVLLEDLLEKQGRPGQEKMAVGSGKAAAARVLGLTQNTIHGQDFSLVEVELLTGRTHQIRTQLSSRGHPIVGDGKYGGPPGPGLLLHAWKLTLPGLTVGLVVSCPPPWPLPWAVP